MIVRLFAIVVAAACAVDPAIAAEVEIAKLTWVEVRDRIAAGWTTAIIPTGGTEQNGRHMVIGKHNSVVAEAARRVAAKLGCVLVAPVLPYTPEGSIASKSGHMAYAGTVSVPDDVFAAVIEAVARSLKAHGFKTIILLGDSGPNQQPQAEVAARLSAGWAADGVSVLNAAAYYAANGGEQWLKDGGANAAQIGSHAGLRDTSELLAVDAAGVHMDRVAPDADGAIGDASGATAALGETLLGLKVDAAVAEIRAARPPPPVFAPGLLVRLWRLIAG